MRRRFLILFLRTASRSETSLFSHTSQLRDANFPRSESLQGWRVRGGGSLSERAGEEVSSRVCEAGSTWSTWSAVINRTPRTGELRSARWPDTIGIQGHNTPRYPDFSSQISGAKVPSGESISLLKSLSAGRTDTSRRTKQASAWSALRQPWTNPSSPRPLPTPPNPRRATCSTRLRASHTPLSTRVCSWKISCSSASRRTLCTSSSRCCASSSTAVSTATPPSAARCSGTRPTSRNA